MVLIQVQTVRMLTQNQTKKIMLLQLLTLQHPHLMQSLTQDGYISMTDTMTNTAGFRQTDIRRYNARSDLLQDPWYSPAGFNRGQYLGITKLAFQPKQISRDDLYRARINPIVTFPGQ